MALFPAEQEFLKTQERLHTQWTLFSMRNEWPALCIPKSVVGLEPSAELHP